MDDLTPWFIIGFLISGVIAVVVPDNFFAEVVPSGWISSVLMLVVGTPLYICAAATTPVAATLIAKGLDPGAALVLLLVGPATNAATVLVVYRFLGKTVLSIYLLSITGVALVLGALVNLLYSVFNIELAVTVSESSEEGMGWLPLVTSLIVLFLIARSALRIHLLPNWGQRLRKCCLPLGFDPASRLAQAVVLLTVVALYLSSGVGLVGPGQVGWVVRFGKVQREITEPALVLHWPTPFESLQVLRSSEVRGVDVGLERILLEDIEDEEAVEEVANALLEERNLQDESEVMTGDESLLSITYSIHYSVQDPFRYQFRIADPEQLVRAFGESALRESVGRRPTDDVLVTQRGELERETLRILQVGLDSVQSGVQVQTIALHDVHAPMGPHFAFRDVASALEDKQRLVRQAEGYESETLAQARADAFLAVQEAETYRDETMQRAAGEAHAFLRRLEAYREHADLTRLRLYLDAMDRAYDESRSIFLLGEDIDVDLMSVSSGALPPLTPRD
jgi:membrane protease subunit HflK